MMTDDELEKLLDDVLWLSDPAREWLKEMLSPASRIDLLEGTIKIQENLLDVTEPFFLKGVDFSNSQKQKRQKRVSWGGLTPAEIGIRNRKILKAWQKSKLSKNSFAQRQSELHGLSVSRIKQILKNSK